MNSELKRGDKVVWYQARRGFHEGKHAVPAVFIEYRGIWSARIRIEGEHQESRVVRLTSLQWEGKEEK